MTLISDSHRFVFVHVPKTGGESIKKALGEVGADHYFEKSPQMKHLTAQGMIEKLPEVPFGDYFSFGFVRNPWARLLSFYQYKDQNPFHPDYVAIRKLGSFDAFVRDMNERGNLTQSRYLFDDNGKQIVDFVGRFENLSDDFGLICEKVGLEGVELPHKNKSGSRPYQELISAETRQIIASACREEIDRFGYQF